MNILTQTIPISLLKDPSHYVGHHDVILMLCKVSGTQKDFFVKSLHKMESTHPPSPFYEVPIYFFPFRILREMVHRSAYLFIGMAYLVSLAYMYNVQSVRHPYVPKFSLLEQPVDTLIKKLTRISI